MEIPAYFGEQEDVTWHLAPNWKDALRLAWAREQHELAYKVHLQLLQHKNSIPDLAEAIGQRRENLWQKLTGRIPAQQEDFVLWTWLTGERRRTYKPEDLFGEGFVIVPKFPFSRRRAR
jgi:hypothetical protein